MHHLPKQLGVPLLGRLWVLWEAWAKESESLQTYLHSPQHGFTLPGKAAQTIGFFSTLSLSAEVLVLPVRLFWAQIQSLQ